MGLARQLLLKGSESTWLERTLSRRRSVRRAVSRFMPGEDAAAALAAARSLEERGIGSILTLLGENVADERAARKVVAEYEDVLRAVGERNLDADISVKPSHLGLDLGMEVAYRNLKAVVEAAAARDRFVAIDMESSAYVDPTLDLYRRLRAVHSNVGVCLQSYLYRTADLLAALLPLRPMIRLVKGAYKEPASRAWPRKKDVDANYLRLADSLLDALAGGTGVRVAFGTHDLGLVETIRGRARAMNVPPDAFEIQMLYGIQREAQGRLAAEGSRVRVLISYGERWFPWYMRRLAERPANVLFAARSLFTR